MGNDGRSKICHHQWQQAITFAHLLTNLSQGWYGTEMHIKQLLSTERLLPFNESAELHSYCEAKRVRDTVFKGFDSSPVSAQSC